MAGEESGGYEFKTKGKLPTSCQCLICQELIRQCVELPCRHPFCSSCLLRWEDQKRKERKGLEQERTFRCMLCNQEYKIQEKKKNTVVDNIITEDIEVLCKHHEQGCPWTGAINDFMQHANTDCPYVEITCHFTGCDVRFLRKAKQQHEQDCPMKEMNCVYCQMAFKESDEQNHYRQCLKYPTKCPNQGCEIVFPKNEVSGHQNTECLFQTIKCEFENFGCNVQVLQKDHDDHKAMNSQHHLRFVLHKYNESKEELNSIKNELYIAKNELTSLKDRLTDFQIVQDESNERIDFLEEELRKSRNENVKTLELFQMVSNTVQLRSLNLKSCEDLFHSISEKKFEEEEFIQVEPIKADDKVYNFDGFNELYKLFPKSNLPVYKKRMDNLFKKMEKGKLYFHQQNIFVKLSPFPRNNSEQLFVYHVTDINIFRNDPIRRTVFANDNFILIVDIRSLYHLSMQITNFNEENSELFLVSRKNQQKFLLKYGYYNNYFNWNDFKNEKNEVIFYLKKK
ncbi:TNF receptor-associated factor family protein DDB_G0290965-like [Clytia hemisphaerica]|uniref:Uncharacterized protein n=1 Tax=Clytia hemisphaerica TaxID=252671 RepID=A0A7M5X7J2_9CNID